MIMSIRSINSRMEEKPLESSITLGQVLCNFLHPLELNDEGTNPLPGAAYCVLWHLRMIMTLFLINPYMWAPHEHAPPRKHHSGA